MLRNKFFILRQSEGQRFSDFVTELRELGEECQFGELKDSLIRDLIIHGLLDGRLRERMLRGPDLDLIKAIKLGQAAEEGEQHTKELSSEMNSQVPVHHVNKNTKAVKSQMPKSRAGYNKSSMINNCKFCVKSHKRGECPAHDRKCHKCKKDKHFTKFCPSRRVHHIAHDDPLSNEGDDDSEFYIGVINSSNVEYAIISDMEQERKIQTAQQDVKSFDWLVNLCINHRIIEFKIDTGAQCNVLPESSCSLLRPRPKIHSFTISLSVYNGSDIRVKGKFIANIKYKDNHTVPVMFVVVDSISMLLIGLQTSEKLSCIKRVMVVDNVYNLYQDLINKFDDCFGKLGVLPREYYITLKDDVTPVVMPPRKSPVALKDKLNEELDKMVQKDVIVPIRKPTDWVNSLVIVEKSNGKLRICLDPRPLNKAVKREHFQLPATEDILSQMSGARYFSKLDASQGYWHIQVDEESSRLLTFATPFGRYRFKRLLFGIHSASEIFQVEIANFIAGIQVANLQDDIIVWGNSKLEYDNRLERVLKRISSAGLKLNKEKCRFGEKEIVFLGHVVSSGGVKADPAKVSSVREMPIPQSKKELQSFFGYGDIPWKIRQ